MNPGDLDKPAWDPCTTIIGQRLARRWLDQLACTRWAPCYMVHHGNRTLPPNPNGMDIGHLAITAAQVWYGWCQKEGVA